MTSVGSNLSCGRPHGDDSLHHPHSTCIHLSLITFPLRVDVINGWPLNLTTKCYKLPSTKPSRWGERQTDRQSQTDRHTDRDRQRDTERVPEGKMSYSCGLRLRRTP